MHENNNKTLTTMRIYEDENNNNNNGLTTMRISIVHGRTRRDVRDVPSWKKNIFSIFFFDADTQLELAMSVSPLVRIEMLNAIFCCTASAHLFTTEGLFTRPPFCHIDELSLCWQTDRLMGQFIH